MNNWLKIAVWTAVILGVFGLAWWKGWIQSLAVYAQETREELKKCSWPSWDELRGSTALISVSILGLGLFVVVIDIVLFKVFFHK